MRSNLDSFYGLKPAPPADLSGMAKALGIRPQSVKPPQQQQPKESTADISAMFSPEAKASTDWLKHMADQMADEKAAAMAREADRKAAEELYGVDVRNTNQLAALDVA